MKIYFVRHGKTKWNLENRYQGANGDSPLLKTSYNDINKLGNYLKDINFAHIYSSPIKRARITAFKIRDHLATKPPITLVPALKEFDLGKMEGVKHSEVQKLFPEQYNNFRGHPDLYDNSIIGGENYPNVIKRMRDFIEKISKLYDNDQNVLVVGHGAALNAGIKSIMEIKLSDLYKSGSLDNTSTTILKTFNKGKNFELKDWNNTEYLQNPK